MKKLVIVLMVTCFGWTAMCNNEGFNIQKFEQQETGFWQWFDELIENF